MINPRNDIRLAGEVTRYHTWPRIREQSVGEHSWQLGRVFYNLNAMLHTPYERTVAIYEYIMFHDCGEIATGDIPYPVKSRNPTLKDIMDTLEEEALSDFGIRLPDLPLAIRKFIKACELLEMMEWGMGEMQRGNKFAHLVAARCESAARDYYRNDTQEYDAICRYISLRKKVVEYEY